jgi:hypothetical protein
MTEDVSSEGLEQQLMEDVFDLIIGGAGPCGLAVAARLNESVPAALFTDEEHRRCQWLSAHGSKVALKHLRSGRTMSHTRETKPGYHIAVLDATATNWMTRWNSRFQTLDIPQLRSPLPWHLDPKDIDSLRGFAHRERRSCELVEIKGCVGRELSKHAKKRRQSGCGKAYALFSHLYHLLFSSLPSFPLIYISVTLTMVEITV